MRFGLRCARMRMIRLLVLLSATAFAVCLAPSSAPAATWKVCTHPGGILVNNVVGDSGIIMDHFRIRGSRSRCYAVYNVAMIVSTRWGGSLYRTKPRRVQYRGRTIRCSYERRPYSVERVTCARKYRFDMSPGGE